MTSSSQPPSFGCHAPGRGQNMIRSLARYLPYTYAGRKLASLLLGMAGGRTATPRDVVIFEFQMVRLHPYDNIAEKRVYLTPDHWDKEERLLLNDIIKNSGDDTIRFIDIGANAGLYTLFAHRAAMSSGKAFSGLCVEPDPVMAGRLQNNLCFSQITDCVAVRRVAVSDRNGLGRLFVNKNNRGMTHLESRRQQNTQLNRSGAPKTDQSEKVKTRALLDVINEWDCRPATYMKIDIEGMELPALRAFFNTAPSDLYPNTLQIEISHENDSDMTLKSLCKNHGYHEVFENHLNLIMTRK